LTTVYSARDSSSEKPCAVKVIRDDWQDQPTAIKLLQREARAGMRVDSPRVVRFLDAHVTVAPYFLVMEWLSGESLRRKLRRDYRLPPAQAFTVARQTAEGLAALHRAGFVHGDVKPENVRVRDGGDVVLIDLGFAHRPGENAAFLRQGYVLGTPDYLAPELCRSNPQADYASDLFSLGVTLFEMLTGKLPYPPGSLNQTFRRHGCDPPADVRQYAGPLPEESVLLLDRLLDRRPQERPTARETVQALIGLEIASLRLRHLG
jgi:serine/threonine-protein kinase